MKLKQYISERNVVLGNTDDGRSWALKALHPADPLTEVRGIPDESADPSVFQNYQWTFNVPNPTPATAGIWSFDIYLFAHPILAGALRTYDSAGVYHWSPIVNPQVGTAGTSWSDRQQWFVNNVEKFRIGYMGITGHHDSAAVTNQGMIACCQYPVTSVASSFYQTAAAPGFITRNVTLFPTPPKTYSEIQTLPNAYLKEARDGIYAPYKLSKTCQEWQTTRDERMFCCYQLSQGMTPAVDAIARSGAVPALNGANDGFPYGLSGFYNGGVPAEMMAIPRSDTGIIHIASQNLHSSASFSFVIRSGYEMQVAPGSALSTFARISPKYDPVAISGYFGVAREFKDAYPESFNSFEQILGTIANVIGDVVSTVFPATRPVVGAIRGLLSKPSVDRTPVGDMSAAQKDEARRIVGSAPRITQKTVSNRKKRIAKRK